MMKLTKTDDGWLVLKDGDREIIRVKLPDGGITQSELEAFKRHLIAHLHGDN